MFEIVQIIFRETCVAKAYTRLHRHCLIKYIQYSLHKNMSCFHMVFLKNVL